MAGRGVGLQAAHPPCGPVTPCGPVMRAPDQQGRAVCLIPIKRHSRRAARLPGCRPCGRRPGPEAGEPGGQSSPIACLLLPRATRRSSRSHMQPTRREQGAVLPPFSQTQPVSSLQLPLSPGPSSCPLLPSNPRSGRRCTARESGFVASASSPFSVLRSWVRQLLGPSLWAKQGYSCSQLPHLPSQPPPTLPRARRGGEGGVWEGGRGSHGGGSTRPPCLPTACHSLGPNVLYFQHRKVTFWMRSVLRRAAGRSDRSLIFLCTQVEGTGRGAPFPTLARGSRCRREPGKRWAASEDPSRQADRTPAAGEGTRSQRPLSVCS